MTPRVVRTVEELGDVPVGAIVRSSAGTIACRFDALNGFVFGDDRSFPWARLALPATVLAPLSATLHPRTVTKADIEKVMDAIDDALSSVCVSAQAIKCDCPSDDQIRTVVNAALTALGFEVVDGE